MSHPVPSIDFRPSLVSWNLTKKCNLKCPHCYLDAGKSASRELDTAECLALVDEMADLGTEMVILTGGEPLLRKDIYEIASAASRRGLWVVMGTNGVLVTDAVAQKMVECGVKGVGISIDSIDAARHDAFRGGKNAWHHSVRALETCRRHGLEVLVQTTVMEENYDEVGDLLAFARDQGAWSFNLYLLVQTGRGETMTELSSQRTESLLTWLTEQQERYRPMLVRSKCAPQFKRIAYEQGLAGLESGGCMAGTHYCRITPEGNVTPCPYTVEIAGNVLDSSFTEVWESAPLLRDLRDPERLEGRCGACEYRDLCGGCRCRAYAHTGNIFAEDPACPHQPTGERLTNAAVRWSPAARARLERIPIAFIRRKLESGIEAFARRQGADVITAELMEEGMQGSGRGPVFGSRARPS
ncbi:MAG: radical SAM protein [Thermoanaerobaculia bacterium]|nr:radical SAM protein [Thermoanaerobaculia bacterium]